MSTFYNEYKSKKILKEIDIPFGDFDLAKTKEEAVEIAEKLGYPVSMKIVSDEILHKTEAKGVFLNIEGKDEVEETYDKIIKNAEEYDKNAKIEGVIISPMIDGEVEVIVGGIRDPQFGPVVMFGLGGVFVEIFKDVKFRMAPIDKNEALNMIKGIKGFPLLDGARGKEKVNIDELANILVNISNYMMENDEILEIDLNPVMASGDKIVALDALIGVKK